MDIFVPFHQCHGLKSRDWVRFDLSSFSFEFVYINFPLHFQSQEEVFQSFQSRIMKVCKICKKTGAKGFYQIKSDWLGILGLPPELDLKKHHMICYQHFKLEDLYIVGDQVRLKKGKPAFFWWRALLETETFSRCYIFEEFS